MLDTELKIKKVVKALNKLGTLRGINNPVGLYIFVWDTEKNPVISYRLLYSQ